MPDALTSRALPDFLQGEIDQLTGELDLLAAEKAALEERIGGVRDKMAFLVQLREKYLADRSHDVVDLPKQSTDTRAGLGSALGGTPSGRRRSGRAPSPSAPDSVDAADVRQSSDQVEEEDRTPSLSRGDSGVPWTVRVAVLMVENGSRAWPVEDLIHELVDTAWDADVQRRAKTALRKALERMLTRDHIERVETGTYKPTAQIRKAIEA
ncbi:hypothetical protein OHA21_44260 [Actinoplanes sp. NBC_00393]|uniref:hypothetical protein n=1 Tax=Actinoplanes sp. NBC_00393 TaxID=2975953 RepID=UPI002E237027